MTVIDLSQDSDDESDYHNSSTIFCLQSMVTYIFTDDQHFNPEPGNDSFTSELDADTVKIQTKH